MSTSQDATFPKLLKEFRLLLVLNIQLQKTFGKILILIRNVLLRELLTGVLQIFSEATTRAQQVGMALWHKKPLYKPFALCLLAAVVWQALR